MNTRPEDLHKTGMLALDRRAFLKGSAGLVVAFAIVDPVAVMAAGASSTDSVASPDSGKLYAWLAIRPDNTATLFTGKVETGTGVQTALGQIAAEELEFPIDRLDIVMGTTSETVDQGPTYGSMSVRYAGPQIRHAAAVARKALLDLAADRFKLPPQQLEVREGAVSVIGGAGQSVTFGELVAGKRLDIAIEASGTGFGLKVAPDAPVKDPSTYAVIGQSVRRKDIPGKVTGQFTYIQDVKVDGMLHGRVVRPYGVGATLESVDETGLKDIQGFVQVVRKGNFLGVVAETEWAAIQAAEKLGSGLDPQSPQAGQAKWSDWQGLPEQEAVWDTLRKTAGTNTSVAAKGSVDLALPFAEKTIQATYKTPFQMHGSIGPSCAIADVRTDGATFWSGTQMPHQMRADMSQMLGIPEDRIGAGLVGSMPVRENMVLSRYVEAPFSRRGWLDWQAILDFARRQIAAYDVRPTDPHLPVGLLSGGNQQKAIIARELAFSPRVLVIAQPTRGLDVSAIAFVHRALMNLRDEGCAIMLISDDLDEIFQLSDRIAVMYEGEIVRDTPVEEATVPTVGLAMTEGRMAGRNAA